MFVDQEKMLDNLEKTFELIELSKNLSIAKIMQDHPDLDKKKAGILFWKEIHRIKNITSGVSENEA